MSDCMEAQQALPCIKGDLHFEYSNSNMKLTVELWDSDEKIEVLRNSGRWRWPRGPLVSSHTIASRVFTYRPNPSESEMHWMGDYFDDLGRLIDTAREAIRLGVKAELDRRLLEMASISY